MSPQELKMESNGDRIPCDKPEDPLLPADKWTKRDKLLLGVSSLVTLGDYMEMYSPGVIIQQASCDLGISKVKENMLAVTFYFFFSVGSICTIFLTKKLSIRSIVLLSLYSLSACNFLFVVVPTFYTFLLAQALKGFSVGSNASMVRLLFSQKSSSKKVRETGLFLITLASSCGSIVVSLLAYGFLNLVKWQIFVVFATFPLFITALLMLHCCIEKEEGQKEELLNDVREDIIVNNPIVRIVKLSLYDFISTCIGFGSILLLPSIMRSNNLEDQQQDTSHDNCSEVVHGDQFLIIAVATGASNVLGRIFGFSLRNTVPFRVLQSSLGCIITASYITMLFDNSTIISAICIGMGKIAYSMQQCEIGIISFDPEFLGSRLLSVGSSIVWAAAYIGALVGTTLAEFLDPIAQSVTGAVFGLVQVAIIFSITDR